MRAPSQADLLGDFVDHLIETLPEEARYSDADLGHLKKTSAKAIRKAAERVAAGDYDVQFPIDVFQTGSGTSSNMNANEVIAHLCAAAGTKVHPNDDVNNGQSSNDVIPTAIQVSAALTVSEKLLPALAHLKKALDLRAKELRKVAKTGRTHLMDAMPVTFGQELGGWSAQIRSNIERLQDALKRMRKLPLGGTAVGTGINADAQLGPRVAAELARMTGVKFESADNYFEGISSQDAAVELSGQMKTLACSLMKISNDLRWMNSGPLAGLGEIELPALQPGSSIMRCSSVSFLGAAAQGLAEGIVGHAETAPGRAGRGERGHRMHRQQACAERRPLAGGAAITGPDGDRREGGNFRIRPHHDGRQDDDLGFDSAACGRTCGGGERARTRVGDAVGKRGDRGSSTDQCDREQQLIAAATWQRRGQQVEQGASVLVRHDGLREALDEVVL